MMIFYYSYYCWSLRRQTSWLVCEGCLSQLGWLRCEPGPNCKRLKKWAEHQHSPSASWRDAMWPSTNSYLVAPTTMCHRDAEKPSLLHTRFLHGLANLVVCFIRILKHKYHTVKYKPSPVPWWFFLFNQVWAVFTCLLKRVHSLNTIQHCTVSRTAKHYSQKKSI